MTGTVLSLDLESNGLHGQVFAAAAVLTFNGVEVSAWTARCPIEGPVDPWVTENVFPAIEELPITEDGYGDLLRWWRHIYVGTPRTAVVADVAWPIETRFLWDAHRYTPFSGPFPLFDVSSMLLSAGHDPLSVEEYLRAEGVPLPEGSPHHPLYDARATSLAYWRLMRGHAT